MAVAGLLPSGKAVDANLRKLQIDFWVVCVNVRAGTIVRPSVLIAMSHSSPHSASESFQTSDGPKFPDYFPFPASRGAADAKPCHGARRVVQFLRDFTAIVAESTVKVVAGCDAATRV